MRKRGTVRTRSGRAVEAGLSARGRDQRDGRSEELRGLALSPLMVGRAVDEWVLRRHPQRGSAQTAPQGTEGRAGYPRGLLRLFDEHRRGPVASASERRRCLIVPERHPFTKNP